ncbi:hypothetical protein N9231_05250 [Saprospiraceae bacterium]|nr:hypothetical protein [Saprospiraceae bacterium]
MKNQLIFLLLLFTSSVFSQVAINTDGSSPDQSAALDVKSDSLGLLVPRMNSFLRGQIITPATGLLVFDTNTDSFWYFDGTIWLDLASSLIVSDKDGDTYIDPEISSDIDRLYFKVGGTTAMIIRKNSNNVTRLELGDDNTVVGTNSGLSLNPVGNSEGLRNTFLGNEAGKITNSGLNNVAVGHKALEDNTTGSQNTAVGMAAMTDNSIGNNNVAIGQGSLSEANLGSNNSALGTLSGQNNPGSYNTFLGSGAGNYSSGDGNILIGYQAGSTASGSNKLFIHNDAVSDPLIYGEFDTRLLKINGALDINGDYTLPTSPASTGNIPLNAGPGNEMTWSPYYFPTTAGTPGQILSLNNSGFLLWQAPSVGSAIIDNDGNSKIEIEKNFNEDKMRVTLNNDEKLLLESTNNTTRLELIGQENLIIGEGAGLSNVANLNTGQGVRNVYLGFDAGKSNVDGYGNTFVGYQAGEQSDGTVFSTAVGWRSGWKTLGNYNAYFGRTSGFNNINGEKNTFIGDGAGSESTGSNNVFLGYDAGKDETGNHKLYIDNSDTDTPLIHGDFTSNTVTINNNLAVSDIFSLNTTTPNTYFHLNLPETITVGARIQINGSTKFSIHSNGGTSIGAFLTSNVQVPDDGLYVDGNVNIGTSTLHPTYRLQVDGKVACEEVNVELSQDWPDYVFEDEYHKMPLTELNSFIQHNKHLPGIPTAQEVKEEGLNVGEMQKMMMEKIEELTLYVIEINNRNIELEKEIELLKNVKH